jgi:two-component system, chemotaxis family, protein-glutamate methylesterase/glutaminase
MTLPLPAPGEPIRVLVVDDSPMGRQLIVNLINGTEGMTVAAEARNGVEAVRLNRSLTPHIIAMDVTLPLLDGVQATQFIMRECPNRVVLFADKSQLEDDNIVQQAQAAGALDVVPKPLTQGATDLAERFTKTLQALAGVRVVRAWSKAETQVHESFALYPGMRSRPEIVLIVSSTGGPPALEYLVKQLPPDFPLPIIILQHIDQEFMGGMVQWLDSLTPLNVVNAQIGERPVQGTIYFAPVGAHLRIGFDGRFLMDREIAGYHHVPSGDVLLTSAAEVYGANAIGVILTGMGQDGAAGLLKLRQQHARTVVQDEATSVVFGMPKEAIALGAAEFIEPLEGVVPRLIQLAQEKVT